MILKTELQNSPSVELKFAIMLMKTMKLRLQTISILIASTLFLIMPLSAQQDPARDNPESTDYTDQELETFVETVLEVLPLQEEIQQRMIGEIEQRELSVDRFNAILENQQTGQEIETTEEELESFEDALKAIQIIQLEYHDSIIGTIENAGMSPEKYEQIMMQYQMDPELQMRINTIIEEMH
jgi:hypothetical protein